MKFLLDRGVDVKEDASKNGEYGSALHVTVMPGENRQGVNSSREAKLLLDCGADVNCKAGRYCVPIQAASAPDTGENQVATMRLLIEHGAQINMTGGKYHTALQAAARGENASEKATLLIEHGADVNITGGEYGTVLHAAAANPDLDMEEKIDLLELLVSRGADINASGGKYETVLQDALVNSRHKEGFAQVIKFLLEKGADPKMTGGMFFSPFRVAVEIQTSESRPIVQLLLTHDADANLVGGEVGTCLPAAVTKGDIELVQILLDSGADVNLAPRLQTSPLGTAAYRGNVGMAKLLLDTGADVNATMGPHLNPSEFYIRISPDLVDIKNITVLMCATSSEVASLLLDRGADIAAIDSLGRTALSYAAMKGRSEFARVLLERGLDVSTMDLSGRVLEKLYHTLSL